MSGGHRQVPQLDVGQPGTACPVEHMCIETCIDMRIGHNLMCFDSPVATHVGTHAHAHVHTHVCAHFYTDVDTHIYTHGLCCIKLLEATNSTTCHSHKLGRGHECGGPRLHRQLWPGSGWRSLLGPAQNSALNSEPNPKSGAVCAAICTASSASL